MKFRILGVTALAAGALAFGITPAFAATAGGYGNLQGGVTQGQLPAVKLPPLPKGCTGRDQKCEPQPRPVTCDPQPWKYETGGYTPDIPRGIKCDPWSTGCVTPYRPQGILNSFTDNWHPAQASAPAEVLEPGRVEPELDRVR